LVHATVLSFNAAFYLAFALHPAFRNAADPHQLQCALADEEHAARPAELITDAAAAAESAEGRLYRVRRDKIALLIALSESSAMAAGLFILPPVKAQLRCQVDIESNHKKTAP
jgi:hypothetical protein